MTELEKCKNGEYYNCHNKVFLEFKSNVRALLKEYHSLTYDQKEEKTMILSRLFGRIGENVSVGQPFICDYGQHIFRE